MNKLKSSVKFQETKLTLQVNVLNCLMLSITQSFWHGLQAEVLRGGAVVLIWPAQKYHKVFCSTLHQFRSQHLQDHDPKLHRKAVLFYFSMPTDLIRSLLYNFFTSKRTSKITLFPITFFFFNINPIILNGLHLQFINC